MPDLWHEPWGLSEETAAADRHEMTAAERADDLAALIAEETATTLPQVRERPARVPTRDAYAHCLACGRHAGGRGDHGFTAHGTADRVEARARAHTAETGHPTRAFFPGPVTEFWRDDDH